MKRQGELAGGFLSGRLAGHDYVAPELRCLAEYNQKRVAGCGFGCSRDFGGNSRAANNCVSFLFLRRFVTFETVAQLVEQRTFNP